ncbi:MAG: NAD-dependent epimerase/dehydratase [Betaproteobacteria bacterium]|nr:NAD-dependent epimerase/dehydratase [Betaproteobacteria bacterium]
MSRANDVRPVLVTGGAGFVGSNLAHRLLGAKVPVLLFDNLSRPGVEHNLQWLKDAHPRGLQVQLADIRDADAVADAVARCSRVFHFAAQVAVTTSLTDPREDFTINALGTLNVLEAVRAQASPPPVFMTSTNKVYGELDDVALVLRANQYRPVSEAVAAHGISETRPLDFHSPYGCSKGTADQYVRDYARTYGIATVVFRMSCIYGPHQFGTEDQGWVAHFLLRALERAPITLYGDGMQVRDILFVDDLVDAFLLAERNIARLAGQAFNIGGGPRNVISLLELLDCIEALHGARPEVNFQRWRTGDQRYYVSDTSRFQQATGWRPKVGVRVGVERLYRWLREARTPTPVSAGHALALAESEIQGHAQGAR